MANFSRTTAFHEAGHAIAAMMCGEYIYSIKLGPRNGRIFNRRGRLIACQGLMESTFQFLDPALCAGSLAADPCVQEAFRVKGIRAAFIFGAGPAAEAIVSRHWTATLIQASAAAKAGLACDYLQTEQTLAPFYPGAVPVVRLWDEVRTIIRSPGVRNAVTILAEHLMGSDSYLDGETIHERMDSLVEPLRFPDGIPPLQSAPTAKQLTMKAANSHRSLASSTGKNRKTPRVAASASTP